MSELAVGRGRRIGLRIDRADLLRSLAMFLAFAVTLGGLHTVLAGASWWLFCMLLVIVALGSGLAVRALISSGHTAARPALARVVSPLVSAIALAVTIVVTFAADTALFGFIPTAETVVRFQKLLRDAGYSITWQDVPADADQPILCLLGIGVGALLLFAEIVAFSLRLPALVGLPLAAVFLVPGMTPQGDTDGLFFTGSALAYLGLLMVGRPRQLVPSIAIAVAAVLGGLVLPSALPSTDITATSDSLGPSVSTGVNPMIRLGDDLRRNDKHVALSYSTVSGAPEYLRLVVVSDFFSNNWGPNQPSLNPDNRPVDLPKPPGLAVGVTTEREVSYIHVANLLSPWLPVPYPASSITGLTGSWQYVPDSLTVASNLSLARGENYTVSSVVLTPTPEQLLASGSSVPSGFGDFLSLPPDTPELIARTAEEVTAGESSNYEKALALQEYLRSTPFQYSETAPVSDGYDGTGVEVVAKFLQTHRGYCIHFASAMAVMARELGIPSRMIVGFQPGSPTNNVDNTRRLFEVTTQDLHTWPELYFSGIGWVRFEPTPSRGSVPDYANQTVPGVPVIQDPGAGAPGTPSAGRNGESGPQLDAGPTVARWLTSGDWSSWLAITGTGVVLVALIFLPAGVRTLRRRRRVAALRSGRGTAASAWRELLESSEDVGVRVSPTLTPREAVARLQRVRGMNPAGQVALERIGEAVEREGYGRPATAKVGVGLAIAKDLTTVLTCFRAGIDNSANLRATLLPPSLVSRALRLAGRPT